MSAQTLVQRLVHDTDHGQVLDQDRRYLLMRTDVLMGMLLALPEAMRGPALAALGQSVFTHGAGSVRAYAEQLAQQHGGDNGVAQAALIARVCEAAAALGWGAWQIQPQGDGLSVVVRNSPFAAAAQTLGLTDRTVCHAIVGMLQALGQALWRSCQVQELDCAAQHPPHSHDAGALPCCHFQLQRFPFDHKTTNAACAVNRAQLSSVSIVQPPFAGDVS